MKTQVNLKLDPKIKSAATKRAREFGLSLSAVVNATLRQFANTGELHITSYHRMTPYLEKIIGEALKEYSAGKTAGPFDSAQEMIKSLES